MRVGRGPFEGVVRGGGGGVPVKGWWEGCPDPNDPGSTHGNICRDAIFPTFVGFPTF